MQLKFLIIPTVFFTQVAAAQTGSVSISAPQPATTPPVSASSNQGPATPSGDGSGESTTTLTSILDYKSVYDAPTVEEEVKMATERFNLTKAQQDVWTGAAIDRRESEKAFRANMDAKGTTDFDRGGAYRGLRTAHNTFHEIIIGYLSPTQKQAFEADRLVLAEKQKKIAKMPPPPPAPKDTVAPVDSTAIKAAEKEKGKAKKSKKKKKPAGA